MYKIYRMEFDRTIKKNNVKFEFIKGNNNKKTENKKKDKKDKDDNSDVKEGFINLKKAFWEPKTDTFNIVWLIIIVLGIIIYIPINGILLFHRYASFIELDWNGIARSKEHNKRGIWYASNIYNDNGNTGTTKEKNKDSGTTKEETKDAGTTKEETNDAGTTKEDTKMIFDYNKDKLIKHYNNESDCITNPDKCKNWFATNQNKHINPIFDSIPDPKETRHIKSQYDNSNSNPKNSYNNEDSWGIRKGFTHELSDTFDFYRGLIKTFIEFIIPGKQSFDGMNSKLGQHLREKVEHLRDPEKVKNPTIPLDGFGNDNLVKYYILGIVFFVIGLFLSCLAPIVSFLFGIKRFLSDGSGYGLLSFIKAPLNFCGEIIGLIGANLVSCLMPLYFLFYALFFPFINTGDGNKPSYWDEFKCILTSGSSLIPTMVISLFLLMTTIFIEVNTGFPSGSVLGGGAFAFFFIMGIGFARIHS